MSNTISQVDLSCSPCMTRSSDNFFYIIDDFFVFIGEVSLDRKVRVIPINAYEGYLSNLDPISTKSDFFNNHIDEEYEVLKSFANKMLAEVTPIDEEIQEVINNHFWDMI